MRLNALGRAAMNNALRASLQRSYVLPLFERFGGCHPLASVLEIGCGRGAAIEPVRKRFGARRVLGLDLDFRMIVRARRLLFGRPSGVTLAIGDATQIPAADASFDAVFDFGAIHLVPEWEVALDEVRRVLRPGEVYFFEWVTSRALRAFYPLVTEGFARVDVPDPDALLAALERRGIVVDHRYVRPRLAAATNLVGDLIGAGRVATA